MAVRQRKREAGGSSGADGTGAAESPYAQLERALREAYKAVKGGRTPGKPASIELGGLLVKVYAETYRSRRAIFEVLKSGHPLCKVELYLLNREPSAVYLSCLRLGEFASWCAGGGGCWLSLEEARAALGLAGWAANVLAELAGAPVKVEKVGLVKAYDIGSGRPSVLPCLQVSVNGKRRLMCLWMHLHRYSSRSWGVKDGLRLVPIGKHIKMMAVALAELDEMVWEYIRSREREGAKSTYASKHRGEFLGLEEVVLRLPDGTEEVLLRPRLFWLDYIGEDFAVVFCPANRSKISDDELADALRKELEEALGKVVQAVRRYTETGDPRYAALAYIAAEAVSRAGLALA